MDFYWHYVSKDTIDPAGKESFLRAISVASQVFNTISEYIQVSVIHLCHLKIREFSLLSSLFQYHLAIGKMRMTSGGGGIGVGSFVSVTPHHISLM